MTSPTSASNGRRIYLAGPEVFLPNARIVGHQKKELCRKYGFAGVFPMDAECDSAASSRTAAAMTIGYSNEDLIRSCAALIANISPFRGPSADVGTAYEMGYAASLGIIVCAYSNVAMPFTQRTLAFLGQQAVPPDAQGALRDSDGLLVEDWGLADNLMLETGVRRTGGCIICKDASPGERFTSLACFEECLLFLSKKR